MPELPGPGDPGYNADTWFQHMVNVGLNLARHVGTGLPLFNALREHFPTVVQSLLGQVTTVIGQGVAAALDWMAGGPDFIVDPDSLPLAPKGWFPASWVDRIVGISDVPGVDASTGEAVYHTARTTWQEDWSKAMVEDAVQAVMDEDEEESPSMRWQDAEAAKQHMLWIGKRY